MASSKRPRALSFQQRIAKVQQTEDALEAKERAAATDLGRLRDSWRAAWTPWRIVIAGVAAGFVVGRSEPLRAIGKSGGLMQLVSMVSSLVAGGKAQVAAEEAGDAKREVQHANLEEGVGTATPTDASTTQPQPSKIDEEAMALARAEALLRAARSATVDQVNS
ncbi:hypothetical protein [Lysobacter panacisoli]|uniref:Protein sip-5 n=1 Tax=Lysobacter panacisoli TaxID=1255263 RepID=A0ABP9L384_9GAMM|nr:hypothetical protein [Lysobacter panacisoli]